MRKISLVLNEYIDKRDISQYKLAKITGVTPPTIRAYYRNDIRRYDMDVLEKICNALDCELWDIIECIDVADPAEGDNK